MKQFGNTSLLFDQNKISLPDDLQFHDIYDNRSYVYSSAVFVENTFDYVLSSFLYDDISLVKNIKDVYYSPEPLSVYEIESEAQRLSRDNYSIVGTYGTQDLNISFIYPLPTDYRFYVKYSLDNYSMPNNFTVGVSIIKNELAVIFERYTNLTHREIFLDVSNSSFQFQDDVYISKGVSDNNISRQADLKYDNSNLINLIYSTQINSAPLN